MGKSKGTNAKKEAGNARKAEAAARKAQEQARKDEAAEAERWSKGAKNNDKKEAAAAKKADQARRKAERDALLAEEEQNTPGRSQPKNSKTAHKKYRGSLDLSQLEDKPTSKGASSVLNASGIDNALDALQITGTSETQIERHPERRFPAAYAKFEARRLDEVKADKSMDGLRLEQKKQRIRKEFERSDENPFNQLHVSHNASKDEMADMAKVHRDRIEARLTNT